LTKFSFGSLNEEEFFSKIQERISSVIQKRITSEDYEDVVQSAMVELRSRVEEIRDESQLIPLVCEVVRTSIRSYYQQKKREEKVLEFSRDAFHYYQPEINDEGWQEITKRGLESLQEEQPRCAELLQAILKSSSMEVLAQKMEMERMNIYRMLYRC
jgi:DNA-directed RNA polymerase specialized sigma24 family protein